MAALALAVASGATATAAGRHASVPVAAGRPLRVPEPTYVVDGRRIPVGACAVVAGGRVLVLPCGSSRVQAYRAAVARRARRQRDLGLAGGGGAAVAAGLAVAWAVRRARRGGGGR